MKKRCFIFLQLLCLFPTISAFANENTEYTTKTLTATIYAAGFIKNDGKLYTMGCPDECYVVRLDGAGNYGPKAILGGIWSAELSSYAGMAIDSDGVLMSWGDDLFSQLGISWLQQREDDYRLKRTYEILDNVAMVSVGMHCLAVKKDGSLWGWGANYGGGVVSDRFNPYYVYDYGTEYERSKKYGIYTESTPVKIMDGVKYALAGTNSFVIKTDGSLWGWGKNSNGSLGDGTTIPRMYPVKIMDNVKYINGSTSAVRDDDSLWMWGSQKDEDGIETGSLVPTKIMDDVRYVSDYFGSGYFTNFVVKTDGSLWTWGENERGQVGDGTTDYRKEPYMVMENVVCAVVNEFYILALKVDGSLWKIGFDPYTDGKMNSDLFLPENEDKLKKYYTPHKIANDVMLPQPIVFDETVFADESEELPEKSALLTAQLVYKNLLDFDKSASGILRFFIENYDKIFG